MEYHIELPDKDYDLILTEYKEIPLTQGKVALVDVEDYDYLMQWKWQADKHKNGRFYAKRRMQKKNIYMHRGILNTPKGIDTDHVNKDGLDNRRSNLRICSRSQNMMNRGKTNNNISGYKGIHWDKERKKWGVEITINYEKKHLLIYNNAAKQYHKEFARLNDIKG